MECASLIMVTSCAWGSDINQAFTASAIFCQLPLLDLTAATVAFCLYYMFVLLICLIIVCSPCVKYAVLVLSMFTIGHTVQTPPLLCERALLWIENTWDVCGV